MARQRSIFEDLLASTGSTDLPAQAVLLLKNLLDRLEADAAADRPQFRGVVSDAEREALRELLRSAEPSRPGPPAPPVETVVEPSGPQPIENGESPKGAVEPTLPVVELNVDALSPDVSPPPEWVLCLDFGTAKSKAFAATVHEEDPRLEPLAIGKADGDLDGAVHEVSSCVWIDDDGRLFVGSEAVRRGMDYGGDPGGRRRLDSLKQEISQVDPDEGATELTRKLPKDVDPTSTLTCADAVTIYLAYLTDLATTELKSRLATRYVRRRFTVPSWRPAQRRWAGDLLGKSMRRAQLLADTFHGQWRNGIPVAQVVEAVRAASEHDEKLTWMEATESNDVSDWNRGTLEALAAASARLWSDGSARDVVLVLDIGAGTTDWSLFWVVQQEEEFRRAWPIKGTAGGVRQAGDTLDLLLVEEMLRKAGLGVDDTGMRARRGLQRRRVRRLKETLFETGTITETLVNDETVTLSLEEFVVSDKVARFADGIAQKIQEMLAEVDESWERAAAARGITLVLTGGGCDLPMITALKDRSWRVGKRTVACRLAPRVPPGMATRFSQEFIRAYPRMAVAMGGALKTRLDERNALTDWQGGTRSPGPLKNPPGAVWTRR